MTTTRIPQAFAQDGTRTPMETTRTDGVVNLDQGYTDDYSRELGVDPSAKAVERDSMNWLLWLMSSNLKDWQEKAYPQWLAQVQYEPPSFVRYTGGTQPERVFRCIQRPPVGTIPTNTTYWEEVLTDTQNISRVAFIARGDVQPGANFDTLTPGVWNVTSAAILSSAVSAPPTTEIGYLISRNVTANEYVQIYYGRNNQTWTRSTVGGTYGTWTRYAMRATTLAGYGITDGVRSAGWLSASQINLNTLIDNSTYGAAFLPDNWQALNYPVREDGALLIFGNNDPSTSRIAQIYFSSTGALYSRSSSITSGGARTWTEWGTSITSAQQVIDVLLPRNNVWTGTNQWNNLSTFVGTVNLTQGFTSNASSYISVPNGVQDALLRLTNGTTGRSTDLINNAQGERGLYDRGNGRWDVKINPNNNDLLMHASSLVLNANRAAGASFIYPYTSQVLTYQPAFYTFGNDIGLQNTNASGTAHVNAFLDRNGDWRASRDVRANGWVFAGGAYLTGDGDIGGSTWGTEGLSGYVRNNARYIFNAVGNNAIKCWWDGRVQWQIDGTYVGAMATVGDLNSYWPRNEFLRPDQGGWTSRTSSNGAFLMPPGGVWAWFAIGNSAGSNLNLHATGISAGNTTVQPFGSISSCLMWRIF